MSDMDSSESPDEVQFSVVVDQSGMSSIGISIFGENHRMTMSPIDAMFAMVDIANMADILTNAFESGDVSVAMRRSLEEEELKRNDDVHLDLPVEKYSDAKRGCTACTICIEDFESDESVTVVTCGHTFHASCLSEWTKYKPDCPTCRAPIKHRIGPIEPSDEDTVMEFTGVDSATALEALAVCDNNVVDAVMHITNTSTFTD